MNLASLSTLDANDPLPLRLGPRHEPTAPPEAQPAPTVRVVGDKLVSADPETGRLSCWPVAPGAFKTHTDFPNRNPYAKRPSPEVEIALNAMGAELTASRDKSQGVRTGRLETPAQGAKPKIAHAEGLLTEKAVMQVAKEMQAARMAARGYKPVKRRSYFASAGGRVPIEDIQDGLVKIGAGCRFGAARADGYVEIVRAV